VKKYLDIAEERLGEGWYKKEPYIVVLLILFFPIGLYLMWRYAHWSRQAKWIVTGGIALLLLLASVFGREPETASVTTQPTSSAPATATPTPTSIPTRKPAPPAEQPAPKPKYQILKESKSERFDKAPTLYVLVDPVDTSNDGFKSTIKTVVQDISKERKSADFTVYIYDNAQVAAWEYSQGIPHGQADAESKAAQSAQHLIADYSGGIDVDTAQRSTADKAYTVSYFSGADKQTPVVGHWVGTEQFKPR
jgi:hypothetical protein